MTNPTACVVIIGNEVLSGRTRDANLQFLATRLGELGIPVMEARVIPDIRAAIIGTITEVRGRFDHVFTTGGIGPTHDDITSECIAAAFGVPWEPHPEAWARLERHYAENHPPGAFNPARQRMATMPKGAVLIDNPVSIAPGFSIGNVHVLAGVPRIMQAMFEALAPRLAGGPPIASATVHAEGLLEGRIAEGLADIQARWPMLDIGSYPYYRPGGGGVAIVAKGTDPERVAEAAQAVSAFLRACGAKPKDGEPPG
jgi:molybdenum cofactor synthesis domain-containing protein